MRLPRSDALLVLVLGAIVVRLAVGLQSYSGAGKPPKYGDFEAQRHWMEITVNTPVREWYTQTSKNDLAYWGLDYPPMSAYQSWLYGRVLGHFYPAAVELSESRGFETPRSKLLMRWSVIMTDLLVFFPAAWLCASVFTKSSSPAAQLPVLATALLQPAAILIDHGHFQYNNLGLGLSAAAAALVALRHDVLGSILYTLAVNHKLMCVYYAPAFFGHLLGRCLQRPTLLQKVYAVAALGAAVLGTCLVCWLPYLSSIEDALRVLRRITPVQRGLFEDYVANVWCSSHPLFHWKQRFDQPTLIRLCMGLTCAAFLPSMVQQIRRPSQQGLLLCMANSAFAFFIFGYQVHEKAILLPLLPVTLLASSEPFLAAALPPIAAFSMWPLLSRDGLQLAYLATVLLFAAVVAAPAAAGDSGFQSADDGVGTQRTADSNGVLSPAARADLPRTRTVFDRVRRYAVPCSIAGATLLHALQLVVPPPQRYPYLIDALFTTYAFLHLVVTMLYLNWRQWVPASHVKLA